MLVFVDESYHEETELNAKSTFSAVAVSEGRYREFDKKLFELKKHFWKVQSPYEMELKGRKLLSERALKQPKTRDFVEQFTYLCKEVDAVTFAVVQDGLFTLASDSARLPNIYRSLLRRVNTYMEDTYPERQAVFFFDGIDHQTNRKIAISFNNFMYRHRFGQSYRNIIPTPFFCDSEVSPGIQMADVIAYCVNQRYGGRRGYLEDVFLKFRNLTYNHEDPDEDYKLWGFGMCKPDETTLPFPPGGITCTEAVVNAVITERIEISAEIKKETGDL